MLAPLAVTMGEPAGIGGEIVLKAWAARDAASPRFFVLDDPERLRLLAQRFAIPCPIIIISNPAEANAAFDKALPVLPVPGLRAVAPGEPDIANGRAVVTAIDMAVDLARNGAAAGMVTNPIHKATLQDCGFGFPGHTEYLGHLAGATPVMMLAVPGLRVVPVTVHMPLSAVARNLTTDAIVTHGRITARALRDDFGIAQPRLAVTALNPHAGEAGKMGDEESRVIAPAVAVLRADGLAVDGPAPADTLFHAAARTRFDAALCMYHDQALIPLKTIDFAHGVNVTLGLSFVRTSPDHGTAFDIAPRGIADPSSLIAAISLAAEIATRRGAVRA